MMARSRGARARGVRAAVAFMSRRLASVSRFRCVRLKRFCQAFDAKSNWTQYEGAFLLSTSYFDTSGVWGQVGQVHGKRFRRSAIDRAVSGSNWKTDPPPYLRQAARCEVSTKEDCCGVEPMFAFDFF